MARAEKCFQRKNKRVARHVILQLMARARDCILVTSTTQECIMNMLVNLKLVSAKRPNGVAPMVQRRNRLIAKIWEQAQLAKAQQDGATYAPVAFKSVKNSETGSRSNIETTKRVRPWWWTADNGKICLVVKYGAKALELAKGKTAIEVSSWNELVPTLEALKAAVAAGELDAQIDAASKTLRAGFAKPV
jgi:hypothetical protein